MDSIVSQTLNAIQTLYHDSQHREQASIFLTNLQNSTPAWEIATKLLALNHSTEASYYGAQTLKHKIQNYYHELPNQYLESLQNTLYQYLFCYFDNSPIIANQLSLAIADYILRSDDFNKEFTLLFEKLNDKKYSIILFQILIDIIEELQSRAIKLGATKTSEVSEKLSNFSKIILGKMDDTVKGLESNLFSNQKLLCKIFKCLERWIESHMIDLDQTLIHYKTYNLAMDILKFENISTSDVKLHEKAADVFIATMIAIEEPSMYPELSHYLVTNIMVFGLTYMHCARSIDNDEQYAEKSIDYCSLFTELGNLCLTSIISNPNQGFGIIDVISLLLMCVQNNDLEVAEITFNFWYNFAECLYNNTSVTKDEAKLNFFKPYINTLLSHLFKKIILDDDYNIIPTFKEEIGEFRSRIFELIQDLAFASDPLNVANQKMEDVRKLIFDTSNSTSGQLSKTWPTIEASLFVISALAKELISKIKLVPGIDLLFVNVCDIIKTGIHPGIRSTLNTSSQSFRSSLLPYPALLNTSAELIEQLADWLAQNNQQLAICLDFLIDLLMDDNNVTVPPTSSTSSAESVQTRQELKMSALKAVSALSEKASKMAEMQSLLTNKYLPTFLTLAQNQDNPNYTIQTPSGSFTCKLNHPCRQELIKAISIMLPFLKDHNVITQCLSVICEKLIQGLLNEISSKSSDIDCDPTPWLDQISALFKPFTIYKSATLPNILSPMLAKIWPILNQLFLSFQTSDVKTEKVCRSIKHIFRAVGKEGSSFILPQLVETIVNLYQKYHHSSYLYLGSVIIEEFHNDTKYKDGLLDMFENFTLHTVFLICTKIPNSPINSLTPDPQKDPSQMPSIYIDYWNSLNEPSIMTPALKLIPDVIEDFFRLSQKSVKYLTIPFFKSQYFPCVFKIFLATCFLDHREAHSAAMLFFSDMVASASTDFMSDSSKETGEKKKILAQILSQNGEQVIECLLKAVTFELSSQLYPEVADVLYELMVYDKQNLSTWMDRALKNIQQSCGAANPPSSTLPSSTTPSPASFPRVSDQSIHQLKLTILNATQEKHISRAFREFALNFK